MLRREQKLIKLLMVCFAEPHVTAMIKHFEAMIMQFQQSSWEQAIIKGGKFIEAILKALYVYSGKTIPPARKFKASMLSRDLMNMPEGSITDALRITIPRACDFAYDISSNRGARHDPTEVDPNEIDAAVVVATCSWILAEMIRFSQSGNVNTMEVQSLLEGLSRRRYPIVEEVDGRLYFHLPNPSARQIALLTLWQNYPRRISKGELMATVMRHRFSELNSRKAIERLGKIIDRDPTGALKLLRPGLAEAESLIVRNITISERCH